MIHNDESNLRISMAKWNLIYKLHPTYAVLVFESRLLLSVSYFRP